MSRFERNDSYQQNTEDVVKKEKIELDPLPRVDPDLIVYRTDPSLIPAGTDVQSKSTRGLSRRVKAAVEAAMDRVGTDDSNVIPSK